MPRYMLETNICIDVTKAVPPTALRDKVDALADELCIPVVTFAELHSGAEKSLRRERSLPALDDFAMNLEVLPFGRNAATQYGQLRAELGRAGTPCGPLDIQIGAHARSEGLIVVTNNLREFARMPGLRVENWV